MQHSKLGVNPAATATLDRTTDLGRREMYAQIKALCKPNNTSIWWVLVGEYAFLAVIIISCTSFYHYVQTNGYSLGWALAVYGISIVLIGGWVQNRLSCLVHEASHYSICKNRVLNDVVANLLITFPFFGVISNYRIGHWGHHRHVNNPEKDPDLHRLLSHHPRNFPVPKWRFWWEYVVLQTLPHKVYSYLKGRALYVARRMNGSKVPDQDSLGSTTVTVMRFCYYTVLITVLALTDWWAGYALFWIIPMITFYPVALFLREIAHHGNYPDNGDFTNSRVYEGYWLEREIFFPFSERNHILHHMFPTIPWHKMVQAHQLMMKYPPYRENVVICDGFFFKATNNQQNPTVLDVLAAPSRHYLRGASAGTDQSDIRRSTSDQVGAIAVACDHLAGES